jgi:phage shock protein PspC (stress-responsive transcriptional regulator)
MEEVMTEDDARLRRSRSNKMIAGVIGGLARYFGFDPTMARIIYVVLSVVSVAFPGILVYILLWVIMPEGD